MVRKVQLNVLEQILILICRRVADFFFIISIFTFSAAGTTQLFNLYIQGRPSLSIGCLCLDNFFVAGLLEIVWAVGLKYTHGFTRLPSIITISAMDREYGMLSYAMKLSLPAGTGLRHLDWYCAVGTAIFGIIVFW